MIFVNFVNFQFCDFFVNCVIFRFVIFVNFVTDVIFCEFREFPDFFCEFCVFMWIFVTFVNLMNYVNYVFFCVCELRVFMWILWFSNSRRHLAVFFGNISTKIALSLYILFTLNIQFFSKFILFENHGKCLILIFDFGIF